MGVATSRLPLALRPWSFVAALIGLALAVFAVSTARADDAGLEVKHIGPGDRVSVETPQAGPSKRLVPFEEDEGAAPLQLSPRSAKAPATLPPAKKSNFQPRFKTPQVRQAQHVELGTPPQTNAQPADGPQLQPTPASIDKPGAPATPNQALIDEAFGKSKVAKTDADYTEVIDLCRRGINAGLKKNYQDYAHRLLSWSYNRRGEARVHAGNDKEALADFEAAVEANPRSWRAMHNRGVSYAADGRMNEALADFNHTIELNPKYANVFFNRAELKYRQGDFPGAIEDYTAALELNPRDPTLFNTRGYAFYRVQQFGEALRDYSAALRLDPKFSPAMINRADAYADLGRYSEAANDYRDAVAADPKSSRAYQAVAWLMATCPDDHYRNDKLAIDAALKAIELAGDPDYRALETLAAAQANAGQFAEAKETQEKAIAKAPRAELVGSEKRMALYQRDLAYRERPRVGFKTPEEQDDKQVRKASATSPPRGRGRPSASKAYDPLGIGR